MVEEREQRNRRTTRPGDGVRRPTRRRMWALIALVALAAGACREPATGPGETTAPTGPVAAADFDLQGHRGARGLKPENTLPAFETALDLGVTTLEMDLHFTADGVVVVWHDPVIDVAKCAIDPAASNLEHDPRTAEDASLNLAQLTYDQLGAYRCDKNPDPSRFPEQSPAPTALAGRAYGIPTLVDVFEFVGRYTAAAEKTQDQRRNAADVRFNIETKRVRGDPATIGDGFDGESPGPFELAILAAIDEFGLSDRVTIQSFDHRSLRAVRKVDQSVGLAALTAGNQSFPADMAAWGATVWSPDHRAVTAARIAAAHEEGLLVVPWTVNDPERMESLVTLGVDGLITDRPDLAEDLVP
ncbi:MAG: glycerophosphodiester phosphodiesterase [Acidimicrobiia bacterium]|nr:glycerophosphodiester phosphodiesterase [Acidimicrobiia bacterium]